jgi:hypothetical protein
VIRRSIKSLTDTLTPVQITIVLATLLVTFIGALLIAWAFRKWNKRA